MSRLSLARYERPPRDNGRGIHDFPYAEVSHRSAWVDVLKELHLSWCLTLSRDACKYFRVAGIMPVYRSDGQDFLDGQALPSGTKYVQLGNEPELEHPSLHPWEWAHWWVERAERVFSLGGYPGLQCLKLPYFAQVLQGLVKFNKQHLLTQQGFIVTHSYSFNHPLDYTQDEQGPLLFMHFRQAAKDILGSCPPIIDGECGEKIGDHQDKRFPPTTPELHALKTVNAYLWFASGQLMPGLPLPNEYFARCPWLIGDRIGNLARSPEFEDAAWFSDRPDKGCPITVSAVKELPDIPRVQTECASVSKHSSSVPSSKDNNERIDTYPMPNIDVPVAYQIESGAEPGHPLQSGEANCGPACLAGLAVWAGWSKHADDALTDSIRVELSGADTTNNPPLPLHALTTWLEKYSASTTDIALVQATFDAFLANGHPILLLCDNTKLRPVQYPGPAYFGRHFIVISGQAGEGEYSVGDPLLNPTATSYTKASVIDAALQAAAIFKPDVLDVNALKLEVAKDQQKIKQLQSAVNAMAEAAVAAEQDAEQVGYKPKGKK